jgi:hypothetical protein
MAGVMVHYSWRTARVSRSGAFFILKKKKSQQY